MGYKKKKPLSKMQKLHNLKRKRKDTLKQTFKKVLKKSPTEVPCGKKEFKFSYGDDSSLRCYDGIWVKQEAVASLDKLKTELMEQNISNKKVKLIMMKAKRKANRVVQSENRRKLSAKKTEDKDGDAVME